MSIPSDRLAVFLRNEDGRPRATVRVLVPVIAYVVVVHLLSTAVAPLLGALDGGPASVGTTTLSLLVRTPVVLVPAAVALLVARRLDRRPLADVGVRRSRTWLVDLLGGLVIGALTIVAVGVALLALGFASLTAVDPALPADPALSLAFLGVGLLYVVANVVSEELVFRGIVLRTAAEGLAARSVGPGPLVVGSILASTAVFGVWHPLAPGESNVVRFLLTSGAVGITFGLAYLLTGDLALPIGVHLGGGLVWYSLFQPSLAGVALPTVVRIVPETRSLVSFLAIPVVRVSSGILLVLVWAYLTRGELSPSDRLLQRGEADARSPDRRGEPASADD
jgi:membrane protease YdiL (CAAX protease family)